MLRLLIIFCILNLQVFAQMPGDLVSDFGTNGKVILDFGDLDHVNTVAMNQNDEVFFAGYTTSIGPVTNTDFILGKLNRYGSVDSSFGVNGFYTGDFPKSNASIIHQLVLVNDGIILFGSGVDYGVVDTQYIYVSKIDYTGALDTSFADSGTFSGAFLTPYNFPGGIQIQDNGKIVICGSAYDSLTVQDVPIVGRLNADGSPDESFSLTGFKFWDMTNPLQDAHNIFFSLPEHGAGGFFQDVLVKDNGDYMLTGFYNSGTTISCLMALIDSNGNFVQSFGSGGFSIFQHTPSFENKIVEAIEFDGEILIGLYVDNLTAQQDFIFQLVDSTGGLNTLFNLDFSGQKDQLFDIYLQNGSFYAAGYSLLPSNIQNGYHSDFFALAKYDSFNVLNGAFASAGQFMSDFSTNDETGSTCISGNGNHLVMAGYLNNVVGNNVTDFGFMLLHDRQATSIESEVQINELVVYPNPAHGKIYVKYDAGVVQTIIRDSQGKIVKSFNGEQTSYDVSELPPGFYAISIQDEFGNVISKKIVLN